MPSKKCCVSGCWNFDSKAPDETTWHPFPKNEDLAEEWMAKIGKTNEKRKRNSLVCSEHFEKNDFKTSSYNLRNKTRILTTSAVPSIFKGKNKAKIAKVDVASKSNIFVLPLDVFERIFVYLSPNDIISLSSTSKHLQTTVQTLAKKFDCSYNYRLDTNSFLSYTLSTACTSINLNHCYWLKPNEILKIIRKTNLQHLHIIECGINNECIEAICDLDLISLSISYTSDWRLFFEKRKVNAFLRGFRGLKSLEIFYKNFASLIILEIYSKVLLHCKELEHFKLFQCISQSNSYPSIEMRAAYNPNISLAPTLVPKLKSLVVNLQNVWDDPNVARLTALILKNKVILLEYTDFGYQTGFLYRINLLPNSKVLMDKTTLSLCCMNTDHHYWLNLSPVQNLFSQPDYKTVQIKNVEPNGFYQLAQKIVSNSGKTLKELHIKHQNKFSNFQLQFLDGLLHIAMNCFQITVLDISGHMFQPIHQIPYFYISNQMVRKHKAILSALTNLKNLEKLAISPAILHCKYFKSNGEKCEKAMPFWKVTSACNRLSTIHIGSSHLFRQCYDYFIHEDSLYAIAECAGLKALHLVNFQIQSSWPFALPRITESCGQLQELFIRNMGVMWDRTHRYIFNKNFKILSTYGEINCTEELLNNLSQCKNLEKLYVDILRLRVCDYELLVDALRKLKNLNAFVVRSGVIPMDAKYSLDTKLLEIRNEHLDNMLKSIAEERPAFFHSVKGFHRHKMPSAHHDALYYYGVDDYYAENAFYNLTNQMMYR